MSIKLMTVVWDLDLPPGEKLVLLALVDQANDDGRNCWPSVETICKRSGQGERTVRRALQSLESKGLLTRHHREGTSTQYHVHPCQIGTPAETAPLPKTTKTPAKLAPKPSRTIKIKPKEAREHVIPDGWKPSQFGKGTKSRKIVDGWPPDDLSGHLEHFTAHHRARGNKFKDWQDAWSTWVLNSGKFGGQKNGNANRASSGSSPDRRSTLARAIDDGLEFLGTGAQAGVS